MKCEEGKVTWCRHCQVAAPFILATTIGVGSDNLIALNNSKKKTEKDVDNGALELLGLYQFTP